MCREAFRFYAWPHDPMVSDDFLSNHRGHILAIYWFPSFIIGRLPFTLHDLYFKIIWKSWLGWLWRLQPAWHRAGRLDNLLSDRHADTLISPAHTMSTTPSIVVFIHDTRIWECELSRPGSTKSVHLRCRDLEHLFSQSGLAWRPLDWCEDATRAG